MDHQNKKTDQIVKNIYGGACMGKRARIFNLMQYEKHPKTGELLLNEDMIKVGVSHKSIKRYAYICHDRDVYTEEDEKKNPEHKKGMLKGKHWHIVIETPKTPTDIEAVAKWFNIPANFIEVPKGGKRAFIDCVQYLTHERADEQAKGKTLYSDDEVKANFDFRAEINLIEEMRYKYGRDLTEMEQMEFEVLYKGRSLDWCVEQNKYIYMKDMDRLKKCRIDYIKNRAELPKFRINYYIEGRGGIGKNVASRALARVLFPDLEDCDCYFEVGGKNVSFDGYDGQPVIIWNDKRAADFIQTFGRGETFDIFDSHPTRADRNIKYGSIRLINKINIVNGIESYRKFMDGLSGEYTTSDGVEHVAEDKGQTYRRFPIIMCLRENDFDVLLNMAVMFDTPEYDQYMKYKQVQGSFKKLAERLDGEARQVVEEKMLESAKNCTEMVKAKEQKKITAVEDIPDEFKNYGGGYENNSSIDILKKI